MNISERIADRGITIGLTHLADLAGLSGLEIVEGMGNGSLPMPPIAGVLPFVPHCAAQGSVEFRAMPEAQFYNPMGSIHGGWSMTMLDTALGIAAHTTLKSGEMFTSLETAVKFIRPIFEKTGEVRIVGEVVSRGRSVITVVGRIEDLAGKLYATGTSTCMVMAAPKST